MPPNNTENTNNQPQLAVSSKDSKMIAPVVAMLNKDEHVVTIVHRSIIGLVLIYLAAFGGVAALLALVVLAFPDLFSELSQNSNILLMAAVVFALALIYIMLFLATYIYRQNILVVTDQNLIQILQRGLFSRRISRLSMSNVEDVTADQRGFLPTIFNFGTLMVQTAGEMENFIFTYCPNPNVYADRILDAREAYANRSDES
jgi:membrane protein YdbS with pleckstrin-like domain